jgi:NADPH-dependent 2,4-dienoyl-CoA reductase/sulfur reductase-like enzyme
MTTSDIARQLQISRQSVSLSVGSLREAMMVELENDPIVFGNDEVVEVDEMYLRGLKDKVIDGVHMCGYIVGIVSRQTGVVYLEAVPDRTEQTLTALIRGRVDEGGIVMTDAWGGYVRLGDFYTHLVINKEVEGFSRFDAAHNITVTVNRMEGTLARLRGVFHAAHGYPGVYVKMVLGQFMHRSRGSSVWDLLR